MTTPPRDRLRQALILDEGRRLKPYLDCCGKYWRLCTCATKGKLTIGSGRNLDDDGISVAESDGLLDDDIDAVIAACASAFPWFLSLTLARQDVVANMTFNLGLAGVQAFPKMLAAIAAADFAEAARQMLSSVWAREVGARAARLAAQMETGVYA